MGKNTSLITFISVQLPVAIRYKDTYHVFDKKLNWNSELVILFPDWPEKTNMESRATATGKLPATDTKAPSHVFNNGGPCYKATTVVITTKVVN